MQLRPPQRIPVLAIFATSRHRCRVLSQLLLVGIQSLVDDTQPCNGEWCGRAHDVQDITGQSHPLCTNLAAVRSYSVSSLGIACNTFLSKLIRSNDPHVRIIEGIERGAPVIRIPFNVVVPTAVVAHKVRTQIIAFVNIRQVWFRDRRVNGVPRNVVMRNV